MRNEQFMANLMDNADISRLWPNDQKFNDNDNTLASKCHMTLACLSRISDSTHHALINDDTDWLHNSTGDH